MVGPEQEGPQTTHHDAVGHRRDQQAGHLVVGQHRQKRTQTARPRPIAPPSRVRQRRQPQHHRRRNRGHHAEQRERRASPDPDYHPAQRRPHDLRRPVCHRVKRVARHLPPRRRHGRAQCQKAGHDEKIQGADGRDETLQQREASGPGQAGGQHRLRRHRQAGDPRRAVTVQQRARQRRQHHFRDHPQPKADDQRHAAAEPVGDQDGQRRDDTPASEVVAQQRKPVRSEPRRAQQGRPAFHDGAAACNGRAGKASSAFVIRSMRPRRFRPEQGRLMPAIPCLNRVRCPARDAP